MSEVPNGPGLLYRQGAVDHRKDVSEGPGGGDCGKREKKTSFAKILLFLSPCVVLWGRKHWLLRLSAPLRSARLNADTDIDTGIFWQTQFHFLFIPHTRAFEFHSSPSLKALNTKQSLVFKEIQAHVPSACDSPFQSLPSNDSGPVRVRVRRFSW